MLSLICFRSAAVNEVGENGLMSLPHLVIIIIILANKYVLYIVAHDIDSQVLPNVGLQ